MSPRLLSTALLVALGGSVAGASSAHADASMNCDAYATSAMNQVKENRRWNCGYTGRVWSNSFSYHRNWCAQPNIKPQNATSLGFIRAGALKRCIDRKRAGDKTRRAQELKCLTYAKRAQFLRAQVNAACSAKEWPKNMKQDVDHCMRVGLAAANQENAGRVKKIGGCRPKTFVNPRITYARTLVHICYSLAPGNDRRCSVSYRENARRLCKHLGYRQLVSFKGGFTRRAIYLECVLRRKNDASCFCFKSGNKCGYIQSLTCRDKI